MFGCELMIKPAWSFVKWGKEVAEVLVACLASYLAMNCYLSWMLALRNEESVSGGGTQREWRRFEAVLVASMTSYPSRILCLSYRWQYVMEECMGIGDSV